MLNVAGIQIFGVPTSGEFIDEDHTKESVAILGCKSKKKYFAKPAFLIPGSHSETDGDLLYFGFEDISDNR